jgi:hypothetical protein
MAMALLPNKKTGISASIASKRKRVCMGDSFNSVKATQS